MPNVSVSSTPPKTRFSLSDLPLPEAEKPPAAPRSGRRCARFWRERGAMKLVNGLICFYSFLEVGCRPEVDFDTIMGPPAISKLVRARAVDLLRCARSFTRSGVSPTLDGGRRMNLIGLLSSFSKGMYGKQSATTFEAGAEWVKPDQIAIPSAAGGLHPRDHLTAEQYAEYRSVSDSLLPVADQGPHVKGCHKVRRDDDDALAERLLGANMACLIPEEKVARDARGKLLCGFFFALRKDEATQRLIYDRRPLNALERRRTWIRLPAAAMLTWLVLKPGEVLRGTGRDLSNFYFHIWQEERWWPRNAVGPRVSRKVVKK